MGRKKIKIERKADNQQQLATYNKRRNGIAKKGHELSILCDARLLLLSISPKGKNNLVLGHNSNLEDMIQKYASLSSEERHNGRLETIEALKKAFKGDPDHEVDVQQLMNHGVSANSQAIQGQQSDEISQIHDSLFNIDNIPMIANIGELSQMQIALEKLINLNRQKKMSMLEERARARAFQQVAMNHPGPQNVNPMNQGTNLIQSNMGPAGNSVTVSDPPMEALELARNSDPSMAALPKLDEEVIFSVDDLLNLADECILDN